MKYYFLTYHCHSPRHDTKVFANGTTTQHPAEWIVKVSQAHPEENYTLMFYQEIPKAVYDAVNDNIG